MILTFIPFIPNLKPFPTVITEQEMTLKPCRVSVRHVFHIYIPSDKASLNRMPAGTGALAAERCRLCVIIIGGEGRRVS